VRQIGWNGIFENEHEEAPTHSSVEAAHSRTRTRTRRTPISRNAYNAINAINALQSGVVVVVVGQFFENRDVGKGRTSERESRKALSR